MPLKKVLVTGMSGVIGTAVHRELGDRYDMSALNRRDVPGVPCPLPHIPRTLEPVRPVRPHAQILKQSVPDLARRQIEATQRLV